MQDYKKEFIKFAIDLGALKFGNFTLKSGRVAPYFFSIGMIYKGSDLKRLGEFYAAAIKDAGLDLDVVFGPAYKGIPLACATVSALSDKYNTDVAYCFNRKEQKQYGEKEVLVGGNIENKKVVIVDDVITAGTAIREVMTLLEPMRIDLQGIVIALDREEPGQGDKPATQEVSEVLSTKVISIVSLGDIISFLKTDPNFDEQIAQISAYKSSLY